MDSSPAGLALKRLFLCGLEKSKAFVAGAVRCEFSFLRNLLFPESNGSDLRLDPGAGPEIPELVALFSAMKFLAASPESVSL